MIGLTTLIEHNVRSYRERFTTGSNLVLAVESKYAVLNFILVRIHIDVPAIKSYNCVTAEQRSYVKYPEEQWI